MIQSNGKRLHAVAIANLACLIGYVVVSLTDVVPEARAGWNATWITLLGCAVLLSLVMVVMARPQKDKTTDPTNR